MISLPSKNSKVLVQLVYPHRVTSLIELKQLPISHRGRQRDKA